MPRQTAAIPAASQKDGAAVLSLEFDPASDGWFLYALAQENGAPLQEFWHMTKEDALAMAETDWSVTASTWQGGSADGDNTNAPTLDANGTALENGDTVTLIKDLPVKGAGVTLKRGTLIKNISLTANPEEIDCRTREVKGLVLKSCFVKKG